MKSLVAAVFLFSAISFAQPAPMQTQTINGFTLSGSEYWPFVGDAELQYPEDVLWGFEGESNSDGRPTPATAEAQACARVSYDALLIYLNSNPTLLQQVVARGATSRFYLWTDDYSRSVNTRQMRSNRMWHWNRGTPNLAQGYWKWEAVLTFDGRCLIPESAQIERTLQSALRQLGG